MSTIAQMSKTILRSGPTTDVDCRGARAATNYQMGVFSTSLKYCTKRSALNVVCLFSKGYFTSVEHSTLLLRAMYFRN